MLSIMWCEALSDANSTRYVLDLSDKTIEK